jgi:PhnB protein
MAVKPRPDGYHSVTPYLVVDGAARVIDLLKQVFNAQEMMRLAAPGGRIGHADLRIADSIAMRIEDVTPEGLRRRGDEVMRRAERS